LLKRREILVLVSEGSALKIGMGQVRRTTLPVCPPKERRLENERARAAASLTLWGWGVCIPSTVLKAYPLKGIPLNEESTMGKKMI